MHEMGIAAEMVDIATQRAGGDSVRSITVEVGVLTAVLPDALTFCFELAAAGTCAEGASLAVLQPKARARCRTCLRELLLDDPLGQCPCGGFDLEWSSGDELRITEMELASCVESAGAAG